MPGMYLLDLASWWPAIAAAPITPAPIPLFTPGNARIKGLVRFVFESVDFHYYLFPYKIPAALLGLNR